jgi:hypothetical protein
MQEVKIKAAIFFPEITHRLNQEQCRTDLNPF